MDNEKKDDEQKEGEQKDNEQKDDEQENDELKDNEQDDDEQEDDELKDEEQEDEEQEDKEPKADKQKKKDQKDIDRKKIFLVDDTEFSLVRTKQFLKDCYTVFTLDSSSRMFELLEKVKPDMILLDINMPDIDGYQALKILKANVRYAAIPVIFLSGKHDEESIIKGLSLGAVDHIVKPYTPKDLHDRIAFHLHPIKNPDELQVDRDKNVSKQQSILAVDDSPSMLRSIHFTLHNKYKVHTLQKPENLKKVVRGLKPDLFLLDYNMPVINGFQLVTIIREFPEFRKTPVIFLTSESSPDHLNEAIHLGVKDYIVKPFNPKKLREKIAKCLEKKY